MSRSSHPATRESGPIGVFSITPSDTTELSAVAQGLYIGTGGDVAAVMEDGTEATLVGMSGGQWHPGSYRQIKATGTTAANLVGGV